MRTMSEPRSDFLPQGPQETVSLEGMSVPELSVSSGKAEGDGGAGCSQAVRTVVRILRSREVEKFRLVHVRRHQNHGSGRNAVQCAEELLVQKRTYQRHLRRLQQAATTREILQSEFFK